MAIIIEDVTAIVTDIEITATMAITITEGQEDEDGRITIVDGIIIIVGMAIEAANVAELCTPN